MATLLNDTTTRAAYTATASQTTFAYTWWIKDEDHLDVYVDDVLQALTTDYKVSATQQTAGGNVVFNSGLTSGQKVVIDYNPDIERASDFQTSGQFLASSVNLEFAYGLSIDQYLSSQLTRTLSLSATDTIATNTTLPDFGTNQSKVLRIKSDGTGLEAVTVADAVEVGNFESLVTDGNNSDTVFALGFTPVSTNSLIVEVDGVILEPTVDYTVSGTDITFTTAPSTGTDNIVVRNLASGTAATTPADGSVSTVKLQDSAVTEAKLATGDTVTKDKIDDDLITTYTDTAITAADEILFSDVSDSNNMKKDTVQGILDLGAFGSSDITSQTDTAVAAGDSFVYTDASDSNNLKKDTIQGIIDLTTVVQTVSNSVATVSTGTTQIPFDDTIPQNTEGLEAITLSITPTNASNKLRIRAQVNVANTGSNQAFAAALFQDSTADALHVAATHESVGNGVVSIFFEYEMTAGTTSATTFKVRAGGENSLATTLNGASGSRLFGGVLAHTMSIEEIRA